MERIDKYGKWEVTEGAGCINERMIEPTQLYINEHPEEYDVKYRISKELQNLDSVLPRCVEDLITVQGIVENTLPLIMRDRLTKKRGLRIQLNAL